MSKERSLTLSGNHEDHVTFFLDPACPFSWIGSRWIVEVQRRRNINLRFRVLSLSVLNDGKTSEFFTRAWKPVRVLVAAERTHGEKTVAELLTAMGTRMHNQHNKNFDQVIAEAVEELGLPDELARAAYDTGYDDAVRACHQEGIAPVGPDVGSPVLHIDGAAIFGPVLNAVPRGEDAVRLYDALRTLTLHPHFCEVKRAVPDGDLQFD
ncbi:disulfide bond formation protein DsbA [Streptomyces sp. NPDC048109]|uniref:mycothiol-dependent nitroreductase Rv2466c family protein n=1 Tax=unclassified Streptomyces TaxID=2593676 RepID=UPI0033D4B63D